MGGLLEGETWRLSNECDGKRLTMYPPPHCSQSVRGGGKVKIKLKDVSRRDERKSRKEPKPRR